MALLLRLADAFDGQARAAAPVELPALLRDVQPAQ